MKTQKQRILEALKHWISPADAFRIAGTLKLSSRVCELRAEGYDIEDKWTEDRGWKVYRLRPKEPKTRWVDVKRIGSE